MEDRMEKKKIKQFPALQKIKYFRKTILGSRAIKHEWQKKGNITEYLHLTLHVDSSRAFHFQH